MLPRGQKDNAYAKLQNLGGQTKSIMVFSEMANKPEFLAVIVVLF